MFDSTEPQVIEAGLQHSRRQGASSTRPTSRTARPRARGSTACSRSPREYGAAVICLAIDEEGQARDADWKLRVAQAHLRHRHRAYGLEPTDLIFDVLTFPLGSGQEDLRRDGMETIEAIRRVKAELPGASTILGLSNVSFGLKPALRHVLNSVFLHECREAGLDAAIVHAARIMPMHKIDEHVREVALDLIYDRRARRLRPAHTSSWRCSRASRRGDGRAEDRSGWPVEERLKHRIIDGERDGLEADLDEALAGAGPRSRSSTTCCSRA